MRVLLLSALVASTYAGTWNADWWTAYATADSGDTLVVPAAIPTAAAVYDTAITTGVTAVNTALDLAAGADFAAAATAHAGVIAACDTYVTVFATAVASDSSVWPADAAAWALFKTNYEAAKTTEFTGWYGVCNDSAGAAVTAQADLGATACTTATATNVWVPAADQATPAAAAAATDYTAFKAEWDNTNGFCATTWAVSATAAGRSAQAFGASADLTADEIAGLVAVLTPTTTAAPDSGSDKSPAAMISAGIALLALLF